MINYTLMEFEELESTSNFLKENHSYFPHMTIIRAYHQTKGRGQFNRQWESVPKENLLFSILLKDISFEKMESIKSDIRDTMVSFLADHGIYATFKEPNDIYVEHQKICGILIETKASHAHYDYIIIGIGLNVNQVDFQEDRPVSMRLITQVTYDLNVLINDLIQRYVAHHWG